MADSALFNEMIRTNQGILVGDVRQDPRFPSVEAPRLSWLGLPLISKNEVSAFWPSKSGRRIFTIVIMSRSDDLHKPGSCSPGKCKVV